MINANDCPQRRVETIFEKFSAAIKYLVIVALLFSIARKEELVNPMKMRHVLPATEQADMEASTQIGLHLNTMSPANGAFTEIAAPSCRSAAWLTSRLCGALHSSKKQCGFLPHLLNRIVFGDPVELPPLFVVTRRSQRKSLPTQFHYRHVPSSSSASFSP